MMNTFRWVSWLVILTVVSESRGGESRIPLSQLDLSKMSAGWGKAEVNTNCVGKQMKIAGQPYEFGVGTHAHSLMHVSLDGQVLRFVAKVGVDDETRGRGSITFRVYGDDKKLFDSGVMRGGQPAKNVDVPLQGVKHLMLVVGSGGDNVDFDHADWAEAEFICAGDLPRAVDALTVDEPKVILTPAPGPEPRINGPAVFGVRPARPFIYRIPCTGRRPVSFSVLDLPDGLAVDERSGIITGTVPEQPGEYTVTLQASNDAGRVEREFTIAVGDTLALTPPMGWNSWYIHYHRVTGEVMREAADQMIASGMADYGYMYVNIDDCWMRIEPQYYEELKEGRLAGFDMTGVVGDIRDDQGNVLPNDNFSDMQAMTDYIHAKGLRAGIYTSPGPRTCQRYAGSYQHERRDAEQYAEWGFDFLKYDWCSYTQVYRERLKQSNDELAEKMHPYQQMGDILKSLNRDIVLNLCQYGMNEVWTWGGKVGGHCWRTTGDLGLQRGGRLPGFYYIGMSNAEHWQYARPGQWNDPDYILIGWVGSARGHGIGTQTTLTGNEQYSYMSMWALMAAPLFFSVDMAKLDEFTLNVLCNAEVIDVNQDPLGKQARPLVMDDETLIMAKPLRDGSLAVGLFNLWELPREITVTWEQLGIQGKQRVRDVWRQRDLSDADGRYSASIGRHGVSFVRLWPIGD